MVYRQRIDQIKKTEDGYTCMATAEYKDLSVTSKYEYLFDEDFVIQSYTNTMYSPLWEYLGSDSFSYKYDAEMPSDMQKLIQIGTDTSNGTRSITYHIVDGKDEIDTFTATAPVGCYIAGYFPFIGEENTYTEYTNPELTEAQTRVSPTGDRDVYIDANEVNYKKK